jgi:alpha-beta hydrolase superfamily lysophospholipase
MLPKEVPATTSFTMRNLFLAVLLCAAPCTNHAQEVVPVSFPGFKGLTLEGDLYLPAPTEGLQVPGVVLIHGSGPVSRDSVTTGQLGMSWVAPIPVFRQIALTLQALGVAVLTYDKRSCGSFNQCYDNAYPAPSLEELHSVNYFLEDAARAARFLQNHDAVHPEAVVVAGHSQAGQFIPSLLLENQGLMGGVMLAGPFQSIDKMLMHQYQFMLDMTQNLFNLTTDEALEQVPGMQLTMELAINVTDIATGQYSIADGAEDEIFLAGASVAFWKSWIALAEVSHDDIVRTPQPVLIVTGDMDSNVPTEEADYWARHLDSLGQSDRYQLEIFRCLSHSFNCITADDFSEQIPDTSFAITVDPRVADTIASWVFQLAEEKVGVLVASPASANSIMTALTTLLLLSPLLALFL